MTATAANSASARTCRRRALDAPSTSGRRDDVETRRGDVAGLHRLIHAAALAQRREARVDVEIAVGSRVGPVRDALLAHAPREGHQLLEVCLSDGWRWSGDRQKALAGLPGSHRNPGGRDGEMPSAVP